MFDNYFKNKEPIKDLIQIYSDLEKNSLKFEDYTFPREWFESKEILSLFTSFLNKSEDLRKDIILLEEDKRFLLLKNIDQNLTKLEVEISKLIIRVKNLVNDSNANTPTRDLVELMKLIVNRLHKLILLVQNYPIFSIHNKKIFEELYSLFQKRIIKISSENFFQMKNLIMKFTKEEVIFVAEYTSNEKPLLVLTKEKDGLINRYVLKKRISSNKIDSKSFLISKLFSLFEIGTYSVNYKHIKNSEDFTHYELITCLEGVSLDSLDSFEYNMEIEAFSYFLGAISTDAFIFNLNDRFANIYFNKKLFSKQIRNKLLILGKQNPIFHIDYDFSEKINMEEYLDKELFGMWGGIYIPLFVDKLQDTTADFENYRKFFLRGAEDEFERLSTVYIKNKEEIDNIIVSKNLSFISQRLSKEGKELLFRVEGDVYSNLFRKVA